MEEKIYNLIKRSYKKLKSSVFFDKTQLVLRDKIVEFEMSSEFEERLKILAKKIENFDENYISELIDTIDCLIFPKSLTSDKTNCERFITNLPREKVEIDDVQYFLDMDVEGFILGIAWVLIIGKKFDEKVYEHSYGNRLRKEKDDITGEEKYLENSPYLFQPYYQQYESWRDTALSQAKYVLENDHDAVILSLDFSRFYYSVNVTCDHLKETISEMTETMEDNEKELVDRLTEFVLKVIETYSRKVREFDFELVEDRNILPIGFPPSNVLSNFCLKKFDESIITGWNPTYYGRYVDDIIIVDKIIRDSSVYSMARNEKLDYNKVIEYYLTNCDAWNKSKSDCIKSKERGLFKTARNAIKGKYEVNSDFNEFENSELILKEDKIKVFYFGAGQTDALVSCFKQKLKESVSEFRYLPEDEPVFVKDDFTQIYDLSEGFSPNKISGITNFALNKYKLSKFLGKYMRISGLLHSNVETTFMDNFEKIFTAEMIIENYTTWEKFFHIIVNSEKLDQSVVLVKKILQSIELITVPKKAKTIVNKVKECLVNTLRASIAKSFALVWGERSKNILSLIERTAVKISPSYANKLKSIALLCRWYCLTRMCDKYSMPLLIDGFIYENDLVFREDENYNLTCFSEKILKKYIPQNLLNINYEYYPYLVSMLDLTTQNMLINFISGYTQVNRGLENLYEIYLKLNFNVNANNYIKPLAVKSLPQKGRTNDPNIAIKVGNERVNKIKVAVANTKLNEIDFSNNLKNIPNRSYRRFAEMVKMLNLAIEENADMIVLPESYLPFEWLPIFARTCAKNQIAAVTGLEHIKYCGDVYNFTAVILPYTEDDYKFNLVSFHLKNHMAPNEAKEIRDRGFNPIEGKSYELYCWNDVWFPVYCCFELASIKDRGIFKSFADVVVAVEWNKDINYYSNIIESLTRDLHCYCIQVNTSNYGDSRIAQPKRTEEKDIIKVKGGLNSTMLIDELNISDLRDFQLLGHDLQKDDKRYKLTPPDFNKQIVQYKCDGLLWDNLLNVNE